MGDVLMRGEFLSVVEGDGVHEVADRLEATHGSLLCRAGGPTRQLAGTPVITFSGSPKTAPQVAAIAFVIPDHLVDAFMAQLDALFAQPAAAHLAQLRLDLTARRHRELAGLTSYRLPCLSLGFRLLEPIA